MNTYNKAKTTTIMKAIIGTTNPKRQTSLRGKYKC